MLAVLKRTTTSNKTISRGLRDPSIMPALATKLEREPFTGDIVISSTEPRVLAPIYLADRSNADLSNFLRVIKLDLSLEGLPKYSRSRKNNACKIWALKVSSFLDDI
jgi:hypothetical protein